jgi:ribulose kinase
VGVNATCKWNYDARQAAHPRDLYAQLGMADLADKLPPRIIAVGQPVGLISKPVAESLGLTGTTTVVQGGIDAHVATLGAGVTGNDALLMTAGTSIAMINQSTERHDTEGVWGPYPNALLEGRWMTEIGVVSAGSVLEWLAGRMFGLDRDGHRALIADAAQLPAHGSGLLTLDYFMGNRTPYRDANLRGGILGLTLGHDRPHLYRSAVESVAYATKNAIDALNTGTRRMNRFVVGGGIRHNPLWLQATADVLQAPLTMTREANHTLLAGAVAGSYAHGDFASLEEASRSWVRFDREVEPDAAVKDAYAAGFEAYRGATAAATPTLNALAVGAEGGGP